MNRIRRSFGVLGGLLLGLWLAAGCRPEPPATENRHVRYVVGLSPFLENAAKDDTFRHLVGLLLEDLPLNSSLWLYDAYHLRTIAQVEVPNVRAFASSRTRANQFKEPIQALRQFLAAEHPRPEVAGLDFAQAIRLPQFMGFVSENLLGPDHSVVTLLLGSPLYLDEKEAAFSMVDGYFPSDGHLLASREQSVFGVKDRTNALPAVAVRLGYSGDPWVSEIHREKVRRFWTLFLAGQGASLNVLAGDLPSVFRQFCATEPGGAASGPRDQLDPTQTKLEMLRITRDAGVADWITRELPAGHRPPPPSTTVGPLKIGIRWQGDVDLDLYARPMRDGETLFFQHMQSGDGYYFKDHRSSPEREYEFIEFTGPVDVRRAEAFVNFYEGRLPGGPAGEVRLEFLGRIYVGRFSLAGASGNQGRAGDGQSAYWARLDLPAILGLR